MSGIAHPGRPRPVELLIGVDQAFEEGAAELGYAGRIRDLTRGRNSADRVREKLVLPVGFHSSTSFEVPAGTYLIEAVAPSGRLLEREIEVRGDEGSLDVRLADDRSGLDRRGDLAWQVMGGNVLAGAEPSAEPEDLGLPADFHPEDDVADLRMYKDAPEKRAIRVYAHAWPLLLPIPVIGYLLLKGSGGHIPLEAAFWRVSGDWWKWALPVLALLLVATMRITSRKRSARGVDSRDCFDALGLDAFDEEPIVKESFSGAEVFVLGTGAGIEQALAEVEAAAGGLGGPQPVRMIPVIASADATRFKIVSDSIAGDSPPTWLGSSLFLVARPPAGAGNMVALAVPWCSAVDDRECPIDILVGDEGATLSTSVADPQFATLLGYMSAGRLSEAQLLARAAARFLADKVLNPFAAAAGAYVLLAAEDVDPAQPWRAWVANLYDLFPTLPDGAILQGWNRLQTAREDSDFATARELFLEAARRGIPVFSEGVRRLQDGLAMFAAEDPDGRVAAASATVRRLAVRCHPQQAFTTIRLAT